MWTRRRIPTPRGPTKKVRMYRATSKGMDVVEGMVADPGVLVEKEV